MVRKLEKIEKEMGFCDVKLEKERRLKTQCDFLLAEIQALDRFLKLFEIADLRLHELPFAEIAQQIASERARTDKPGPACLRAREDFVSSGLFELMAEDRETLQWVYDETREKMTSFSGFLDKRDVLAAERETALGSLAPTHSSHARKLNQEFKSVEGKWNSLTEDSLNIDGAVFFLSRYVDYIRSARNFLISAKGSFDIENWMDSGYSNDLFRHSNIARAKEMFYGACRNQKMAHTELCCMMHIEVQLERSEPVVKEFLTALFDDISFDGHLTRSVAVVERAIESSQRDLNAVHKKRETLHQKLGRIDRTRTDLFQRIGGSRRGSVPAQ